eukprot:146999_1
MTEQANVLRYLKQITENDGIISEDSKILNDIQIHLCKVFYLSPKSPQNPNIHQTVSGHARDWLGKDIESISVEFKSLRCKYGKGSLIMMVESPDHLVKNNYEIPLGMKFWLSKLNLNGCILKNGLFFGNKTILSLFKIDYDRERQLIRNHFMNNLKQKTKHLIMVHLFVFNGPQYSHYVSYPFVIKPNEDALMDFFRERKWKKKTLLKHVGHAKMRQLFTDKNEIYLTILMNKAYNIEIDPSLESFLKLMVPRTLIDYIDDEKQKQKAQRVIDKLYDESPKYQLIYTHCMANLNVLDLITFAGRKKHFFSQLQHLPCVTVATLELFSICGKEKYQEISRKAWEDNYEVSTQWEKFNQLSDFIEKIEGRKCSFCFKQETNKKYKMCSVCRKRWYCNKQCQKKDWNKTHRCECNRNAVLFCNKMKALFEKESQ